jgi:hypothetical protein
MMKGVSICQSSQRSGWSGRTLLACRVPRIQMLLNPRAGMIGLRQPDSATAWSSRAIKRGGKGSEIYNHHFPAVHERFWRIRIMPYALSVKDLGQTLEQPPAAVAIGKGSRFQIGDTRYDIRYSIFDNSTLQIIIA